MSIFLIPIMASNARLAAARSGLAIAVVRTRGVICHDSPHLSLHQPHALSWPPFPTIAFHKRSVSAWSSVAIWNEKASLCLNAGPAFSHNEAFSFQIATDDQAETDRLWNAIVSNGGQESACGWCKDKWGLSWQITPRALTAAAADPDRAAAKRAFEAMMQMGKIDIAAIEAARRG
jgi:hypothetical protein